MVDLAGQHLVAADDPRRQPEVGRGRVRAQAVAVDRVLPPWLTSSVPPSEGFECTCQKSYSTPLVWSITAMWPSPAGGRLGLGRDLHAITVDLAGARPLRALDRVEGVIGLRVVDRVPPVAPRLRVAGGQRLHLAPADQSIDDRRRVRQQPRFGGHRRLNGLVSGVGTPAGAGGVELAEVADVAVPTTVRAAARSTAQRDLQAAATAARLLTRRRARRVIECAPATDRRRTWPCRCAYCGGGPRCANRTTLLRLRREVQRATRLLDRLEGLRRPRHPLVWGPRGGCRHREQRDCKRREQRDDQRGHGGRMF